MAFLEVVEDIVRESPRFEVYIDSKKTRRTYSSVTSGTLGDFVLALSLGIGVEINYGCRFFLLSPS